MTTIFEVKDDKNGEVHLVPGLDQIESDAQSTSGKREQWKRRFDFLFACVGLSVGLGNVWRFPYLCYKNGGGAFLIPYFVSVFAAGLPLFLLEVSVGQIMSRGGIAAWSICPLFQGIGFANAVTSFSLNCYYNVILSWSLYYLFSSFTATLPWTQCGQDWNSERCSSNRSLTTQATDNFTVDPVVEFWENRVLQLTDGIEKPGYVVWQLALCLLLAWFLVYLCIYKGIKSSGKVMYATATIPYVLMMILLVRAVTLKGAGEGLSYYILPKWEKLLDLAVWSDAGTQIFFSYSISLGSLTALGSYNVFHHNSFRDCIAFASVNTFTSLLAGCVIFATLGHMSVTTGIPIDEVAESGPGLAFVVYPKALGILPGAPFWSICFFLMIMLLGIDSQFAGVEGFVTAITDFYPWLILNPRNRAVFVGAVCLVCYIVGLSMVTQGGMYVFQLFDNYAGSRIILITAFVECIAVGYLYGAKRFSRNMRTMHGWGLFPLTAIFWCVVSPLFTIAIFIASVLVYEELTYKRASQREVYEFPRWAVQTGWTLASLSVIMIPIVMIVKLITTPGSLRERIVVLTTPQFTEKQFLRLNSLADEATKEVQVLCVHFADDGVNATSSTSGVPIDSKVKLTEANDRETIISESTNI